MTREGAHAGEVDVTSSVDIKPGQRSAITSTGAMTYWHDI